MLHIIEDTEYVPYGTIRFGPVLTGALPFRYERTAKSDRRFVHLVPDFVFDGSLSVESSGITFVIVLVR